MSNRKTVYLNDDNAQYVEEQLDNFSGLVNDLVAGHREAMEKGREERLQEQLQELQEELHEQKQELEQKQEKKEQIENKLENINESKNEHLKEILGIIKSIDDDGLEPIHIKRRLEMKDIPMSGSIYSYIEQNTDIIQVKEDSKNTVNRAYDIDTNIEQIEKDLEERFF